MAKPPIYARLDRPNKDGKVALSTYIMLGGKQVPIALGELFPADKIKVDEDGTKHLMPGKDIILQNVEKRVRAKLSLIEIEFEKAKTQGIQDPVGHIKLQLNGEEKEEKPKVSAKSESLELYLKWIEASKNRVSPQTNKVLAPNTLRNYTSIYNYLKEFSNDYDSFDVKDLNEQFFMDFSEYSIGEKKHGVNTFAKNIAIIKTFMEWARKYQKSKGVVIGRDYEDFEANDYYVGVDHLKSKELKLFQDYVPKNNKYELWRDWLLFLCYTAFSISDGLEFDPDQHLFPDEGLIKKRRGKTNIMCYIPYYDDDVFKPVELLAKYGGKLPYILPQDLNEGLQLLQDDVGFTRFPVRTKNGRKTFCTIKYIEQGVPAQYVMKASGHATEKSFLRYVGIDVEAILRHFKSRAQYAKPEKDQ
jgi:hypothetical protein